MHSIDSKINIFTKDIKHSENDMKAIKEGLVSNTVKICEESRHLQIGLPSLEKISL